MKQILMASLLAMTAASASAQVEKVYAGGSLGWAQIPLSCGANENCKTNNVGFKVFVGYDDTAKVAGELGYINFGKSKADNDVTGVRTDRKAYALTLAMALRQKIDTGLNAVARIGVANAHVRETSSLGGSDKDTGMNLYAGLGLEYEFMPGMLGNVSFDATRGGTRYGDDSGLYLLSAGVQYHF